jgi:acetylornithine/succinyldiaminopimelate/putrescine aminotransferase
VQGPLCDVFGPGDHGSTFGGNPVACAAGIAVMEALLSGVMANAYRIGNVLHEALNELQQRFPRHISEVRGMGCMQGIVCSQSAVPIRDYCLEHGLLINVTRERVLRLLPPLIIDDANVDSALVILHSAFHSWELQ